MLVPNSERGYTGQSHELRSVRIEWRKTGRRRSVRLDVVGRVKDISAHDEEGRARSRAESRRASRAELYLKMNEPLFFVPSAKLDLGPQKFV
jgi:hypothetical protein